MTECGCGGKTRIIYACSGAADVGKIADETARKLAKDGFGKMTCLSGIGAHLSGYMETAKGASENIVIDGCPVACGRKIFEHQGLSMKHFVLTDMGLVKGQTPVTESTVNDMVSRIASGSPVPAKPGEQPGTSDCRCGK